MRTLLIREQEIARHGVTIDWFEKASDSFLKFLPLIKVTEEVIIILYFSKTLRSESDIFDENFFRLDPEDIFGCQTRHHMYPETQINLDRNRDRLNENWLDR